MKKVLSIGLCLSICSVLNPGKAEAITLGFSPSSQTITAGNQVNIDLIISDLGNGTAPSLGAFDLDVNFDDSILDFNNLVFGSQLDLFGLGTLNGFIESASTVNLYKISFDLPNDLDTLQADSFTLATLTFNTIGTGNSPLSFANVILADSLGDPLTYTLKTGEVTVESGTTTVPEPSAILSLLGLAAMGLVNLNRQRKVT